MTLRAVIVLLCCLCFRSHAGDQKLVYRGQLHGKIKAADRIVVRDGGDTCCVSAEETLKQPILFEVKDAKKIQQVINNLSFRPEMKRNDCLCCGQPGIDWYRGKQRIALTSWKHGYGIMSNGIVATLTPSSRQWLRAWLLGHGLKADDIR